MQQQGAAHIAVNHWNDEYSKCPLLSHTCPFIHRRSLFQRSTKKPQLPSNKKGETKNKRRGWMNGSGGGRGQSAANIFLFPVTFHWQKATMNLTFFFFFFAKNAGREFVRFRMGNGQCHFSFPSSVTFGCNGLGLISTIWLQLEQLMERCGWN